MDFSVSDLHMVEICRKKKLKTTKRLGRNFLGSFIVLQVGNRAELETECLVSLPYLFNICWLALYNQSRKQTKRTCHSFVQSFVLIKTSGQSRSLLFRLTALQGLSQAEGFYRHQFQISLACWFCLVLWFSGFLKEEL